MAETHPENRLIGYARVSTYGQTLAVQLDQLRAAGCISRNTYREEVTGAHNNRCELLKMLDRLAPGDVVTVTRIDRLARSTFDLFAIVKASCRHRQAHRGHQGAISVISRTVGRHRHQHRAIDAYGTRRPC
jgi:predicted site-specific integrase-resolvase